MSQLNPDILSTLSIIHQRHNSPQRALILGLSAMKLDDSVKPDLWLSLAKTFLAVGHADKALSLLHRFENEKFNFSDEVLSTALRLSSRAWLQMQEPEKAKEMVSRARALVSTATHEDR